MAKGIIKEKKQRPKQKTAEARRSQAAIVHVMNYLVLSAERGAPRLQPVWALSWYAVPFSLPIMHLILPMLFGLTGSPATGP
ncbi:hypothetical protein LY78DRAFT_658131 [Colletotrichum sublineola]|nr:hypothetical protein LY78DRAFT_658131 [Colletotrichum sublineola]